MDKAYMKLFLIEYQSILPRLASLSTLLDREEQQRRDRFYTQELKDRFTLRRGFLRQVLQDLTGIKGSQITYDVGPYGKPSVKGIEFSLSHTKTAFGILLSQSHVGFDLELPKDNINYQSLSAGFCTPEEGASLEKRDYSEAAFYQWWTGKEAVIKYFGKGLSMDLKSFSLDMESRGTWTNLSKPPQEGQCKIFHSMWEDYFFTIATANTNKENLEIIK